MDDLTHGADTPAARVPLAVATNLRVASVVAIALVAISFASIPLLHAGQRAFGFRTTPPQLRAWVVSPQRIGKDGVARGQHVGVEVSFASAHPVHWIEESDGLRIASGIVRGSAGAETHLTVPTSSVRPNQWITVSFEGLAVPLKVWVGT